MERGEELAQTLRRRISSLIGGDFPPSHIIADPSVEGWATTTHALRWRPRAIVRPRHRRDVEPVVRCLAALGRIATVSRGRNIGLGGRLGQAEADFVVDLGDLREISDYDPVLGTITIEAGTSFQEVHDYLERVGSGFFLPAIGGPSDASVVGNALQRGDGIGPRGGAALLWLEAVLRNGKAVSAGAGGADAARRRVGPDLSGLFVQSELGVVTRATFALTRMPAALLTYSLRLDSVHQLGVAVERLRECTAQGILQPGCASLWSEGKRAARLGHAPQRNNHRWYVSGAFYGASADRVRADWQDLAAALTGAQVAHTTLACEVLRAPFGRNIFTGRPFDLNLTQLSFGLRPDLPPDPQARGFAWICPALPFCEEAVRRLLAILLPGLEAAGIPENIALHPHCARELRAFVALSWDRRDAAAEARAEACHDDLLRRLLEAGFPPFRAGHLSSASAMPRHAASAKRLDLLTEALSAP